LAAIQIELLKIAEEAKSFDRVLESDLRIHSTQIADTIQYHAPQRTVAEKFTPTHASIDSNGVVTLGGFVK
jgi:hypothetical protein